MTEAALTILAPALIAPVMNVALARERLIQFQQFVKEYLVEEEDFGTIPGTPKPTLYKPGADKLCELYGLADEYEVTQRTEDFDRGLFDYEVKCTLLRKPDMTLVSSGLGSCNSFEKKYRWRDAQRLCPKCGKDTIIKGKEEYGGGWLCFAKKGGCGAKFSDTDQAIVGQVVGKVQNEDIADLKNTILKMAKKRAKIDATLSATRSSGIFTQDIEDWDIPKAADPPSALNDQLRASLEKEGATSHQPAGAPGPLQGAQPSTQPAPATPSASQPQQRPSQQEAAGALQGDGTQPAVRFIPPNGLTCIVKNVLDIPQQGKTRPHVVVNFQGAHNGVSIAYCFDTKFWKLLHESIGLECHFQIEEKDKNGQHFIGIKDVVYVAGEEYVDGKPVLPEGAK